jgi:hypothetical protein
VDRVRRSLEAPVPARTSFSENLHISIEMLDGNTEVVSINRLKPAAISSNDVEQKLSQHQKSATQENVSTTTLKLTQHQPPLKNRYQDSLSLVAKSNLGKINLFITSNNKYVS